MARMIPSILDEKTSSPGEREIFFKLKEDPTTKDWIVLHSLDIANHTKQRVGEADFIVIIPEKGILCLEVKACKSLLRENGLWYYGSHPHPDARGPFKQAADAMYSIRNTLIRNRPNFGRILFWSAVIFPYITFTTQSNEWHDWQVIDCQKFALYPLGKLLEQIMDRAHTHLQEHSTTIWFHPEYKEPTILQSQQIAESLRPNFEFFESPKSRRLRQREELKKYTEDQFIALDVMEGNSHVLFKGPAGTGKTMLAIEAARRSYEARRKVLLLCYNRFLGQWLEEQMSDLLPFVTTKTLHSQMLAVSNVLPTNKYSRFWEEELPALATNALIQHQHEKDLFDEIIIDEAQDILQENYIDFLDLSLKGNLAHGRWRFFGDFEKQTIFNTAKQPPEDFLKKYSNYIPIYTLRTNCRNTPRIAELVYLLGGLQPHYQKILRQDDGIEPEIHYYKNNDQQSDLLVKALQKLNSEGFSGNEIVILSPKSNSKCLASTMQVMPWKEKLKPLEAVRKGYIGFSTIHSFKGMEASAVIVTDIENVEDEMAVSLFYIAVTRALHKLTILMEAKIIKQIGKILNLSLLEE